MVQHPRRDSNIPNSRVRQVLLLPTLVLSVASAAAAPPLASPLSLDFGPKASKEAGVLNVDLQGPRHAGIKWLTPPSGQSVNDRQARSRNDMTIDSVTGKVLTLRVSAPTEFAHVAFMAEAGMQDVSGIQFSVNDAPQNLAWLGFDPPSEPRTSPRPEVRLFTGTMKVKAGKLDLKWSNQSEPVHLISLQVIPLTRANIGDASLHRLMQRAGDTGKMERLDPLREELRRSSPALSGEFALVDFWLETMINADRYFEEYRGWSWADKQSGLSMFGRYSQAIMWLDGLLADPLFRSTALYPRALFQRGRLEYGMWMEAGGGNMTAAAKRDWAALAQMKVRPDLTAMYLGETIPHVSPCDRLTAPASIPAWAARQREVNCRLDELLAWWVGHRQAPNGELGGKWGDDVEMLRWWQVPLFAGSPEAWKGWARMANGVWASDLIADGYHRRISDVEHAAEPLSDPLLIYPISGDPEWRGRLAPSARQFVNAWTRPVAKDERRFRSAWFGTEGVDERPPRNRDVQMNARAAKSVRFHVDTTDDADARRALIDWSRMWARATLSTDKQKPSGIVPPSIRFSDGAINGDEPNWYRANMFWDYFDWSGEGQIYDQMLYALNLSADREIGEALIKAFDLVVRHRKDAGGDDIIGSERWAARQLLASDSFHSVWGQWRLSTGDKRYDEILREVTPSGYLKFRLTGDEAVLAGTGQGVIDRLKVNWPLLTSEVIFTDRVYAAGKGRQVNYSDMIGMMTGAVSADSPYYHVTWHDRVGDLAYLVRDAREDRLQFDIASFGKGARATAKFWRLANGQYCMATRDPSGKVSRQNIALLQRGQAQLFDLPVEGVYRIELTPAASGAACN